jgi:hypothetical protein
LPDAIANAPQVWLGLELYLGAFFDLTTCRAVGFCEGPIQWTAIEAWAVAAELDKEQREDLHYFISRLDEKYLAHRDKQRQNS